MQLARRERGAATRRGRWRWGVTLLLLLGLAGGWLPQASLAGANGGQTITVTSPLDTSGTPTICTLRDALTTANSPGTPAGGCVAAPDGGSGITIAFALGSDPDWTITLDTALPLVTVGVTIRGPGADRLTIRREATNPTAFRLLHFNATSPVAVSGVTLTGGSAIDGSGGGIYQQGSGALTLADSTLSGNSAGNAGGGFYAFIATVTGSTLSGNSASTEGGGFYTIIATVTGSTLSGNSAAYYGGGFYAFIATVTGSTLSGNSAAYYGGGFFAYTVTVTGSTLSGNSATELGGGFFAYNATVTLANSTLSGNSAGNAGGGFAAIGAATVVNSTLSGNSAGNAGGFYTSGTATVTDTIVAAATGATADNCTVGGGLTDGGGTLSTDATCVAAGTTSLPNTDPRLAPLADNGGPTPTHALREESPARGLADPARCAAPPTGGVDQRGVVRPAGGPCDSGAYQSNTIIALTPATLPGGTVGAAYRQLLTAGGGTAPYTHAVTAGALPTGLTLAADGTLAGTPTAAGTFAVTVTATDSLGYTVSQGYTLTIARGGQTIDFTTPAGDSAYTVGDTFAVGATASSGLAVTFAASGPCTLSGTTVTTTGAGTCTVTASQPGDANYAAAPDVARAFAIGVAQSVVTASAQGGGTISPAGAIAYPVGGQATYTATPAAGQVFLGWTLDGTDVGFASPLTFTVTGDRTLVARFAARPAFADVAPTGVAWDAITRLAARGIIKGYGADECAARDLAAPCFGPADPVARAQIAALLVRAFGWDTDQPSGPAPFADLDGVDPELQRAIAILAQRGIARGYGDGTYGPADRVTHAQAISLISRSMVQAGYWVAVTPAEDDGSLYPNVTASSGHRYDVLTFIKYAGPLPDRPATQDWADWQTPGSRAWTAQVLWQGLASQFGTDRVP